MSTNNQAERATLTRQRLRCGIYSWTKGRGGVGIKSRDLLESWQEEHGYEHIR